MNEINRCSPKDSLTNRSMNNASKSKMNNKKNKKRTKN